MLVAAGTTLGTAVDLAVQRHWGTFDQMIPWAVLVALALAASLVARSASARQIGLARSISVLVVAAAGYGAWRHIQSNYQTAPLRPRFAETWSTMSLFDRIWSAASGGVRPGPPSLAPFALVVSAACVWLATVGRPAAVESAAGE